MKLYHITTKQNADIIEKEGLWPVGYFEAIFAATSYDDAIRFGQRYRSSSPSYLETTCVGHTTNEVLYIFEFDSLDIPNNKITYMMDDPNIFEKKVALITIHVPPSKITRSEIFLNAHHL